MTKRLYETRPAPGVYHLWETEDGVNYRRVNAVLPEPGFVRVNVTPFSEMDLSAEVSTDSVRDEFHRAYRENWIRMALQYLRVHCIKREWPVQFTSEDISHLIVFDGFPAPNDKRWMGAVFQRAKREGVIKNFEAKGVRIFSEVESRHKMPVWVAA